MKSTVDERRCVGHVRCHALAPQVYPLDEQGYAAPGERAVPAGREAAAERGAAACPEGAISLHR
ncbi:ferredoxin [Rhizomonospora bruguierae]|uniref:ferredoxin n=1 Tax=Rhizomonospora bruguierae TaxID=1581705 RepID=UPI001BCB2A3C|nr:ferredoxin [Micromonospora sp. NBRC 107566]